MNSTTQAVPEHTPCLPLWFIHAEAEEGINADLLVRAATVERAVELWQEYYADWPLPDAPTSVLQVPLTGPEGAIHWGSLTGRKGADDDY